MATSLSAMSIPESPTGMTSSVMTSRACTGLPPPLTELHSDKFAGMSNELLIKKAEDIFQAIAISDQEAEVLERTTCLQRECVEWYQQRKGRLTASYFHDIVVRKESTDVEPLVKRVMDYEPKNLSNIPAIKWGNDNESTARQEYSVKMSLLHDTFVCTQAGLVINPHYPHLGVSPDGFTKCECCGEGLLEIKCPYSGKECHPNEMNGKHGSFLTKNGLLNRNHKYYTQVQGQLSIANRKFCDFVVWTPKGLIIERIYHNLQFWEKMQLKLTTFFMQSILPEILTCKLKKNLWDRMTTVTALLL